jgi:fatty-acyl-CoA synthase
MVAYQRVRVGIGRPLSLPLAARHHRMLCPAPIAAPPADGSSFVAANVAAKKHNPSTQSTASLDGLPPLPKGTMLTHNAIISQYVSCIVDAGIGSDDLTLHALPLYHCAQLDVFFGPMVYVGATNILTGKPTPDNLLPLIEKYRVSSFFAPPTVWISLLRSPLFETTDLSTLKKGYYGASIMPVEVLRGMARRLPAVRLWNLTGKRRSPHSPPCYTAAPSLQVPSLARPPTIAWFRGV